MKLNLNVVDENDVCYIAYCYPYTYTNLMQYLRKLNDKTDVVRKSILCKSSSGNEYEMFVCINMLAFLWSPSRIFQKIFQRKKE